jgi:hypothetical protein
VTRAGLKTWSSTPFALQNYGISFIGDQKLAFTAGDMR